MKFYLTQKLMEKPCFHVAVLALLILQLYAVCSFGQTPINLTTDEEALIAFKSRITYDPQNMLTNWSTTENNSICSWIGVTCGERHSRIAKLNLSNYNLRGTIAPHIGNLSFLNTLDLSYNNFTGSLPDELSRLRRMKKINMGFNHLTGNLPFWLSSLSRLELIMLRNNSLTGTIPPLFNLSNLEILQLSYNIIQGNIPIDTGNLSRLQHLDLKFNKLTGSIPYSIFNISSLETFDLTSNSLSGTIPDNICENLPVLTNLAASLNQLTGSISSSIHNCRALQQLSLSFNQFTGIIPREIGDLTMLKRLFLGANSFKGGIPKEIGNLSQLEILSMPRSSLTGNIPSWIFNISSLKQIDLGYNSLTGNFPLDIKPNLPNLEQIYLHCNQFTGQIFPSLLNCKKLYLIQVTANHFTGSLPKQLGNLTELKVLVAKHNNMTGEIPSELGNLNLHILGASDNHFSGLIPDSIFNITSLVELELSENPFTGQLPSNMGYTLPNLQGLHLNYNDLTGPIPSSITNSSNLRIISMSTNSFSGPMPDFGILRNLQKLGIGENNLTGDSPNQELRFLSSLANCRYLELLDISLNPLHGIFPRSIGNLSTSFQNFRASACHIKSSIPYEIGNLTGLTAIVLDENELTGSIPKSIGKLKQVEVMHLEHNRLEGSIPSELCEIHRLGNLYLSGNKLNGTIPACLGEATSIRQLFLDSNEFTSVIPNFRNLADLRSLNLSTNLLSGSISSEFENLKVFRELDLSFNQFSGDIPSSFSSMDSLVTLSLANNEFQGSIPQSFGGLRGLERLDLSHNNLTGSIPKSLEMLSDLKYFNLSYNRLEGEIPTGGCFENFTALSFMQNYKLCGATRMNVKPCKVHAKKILSSKHVALIIMSVIASVAFSGAITICLIRTRKVKMIPQFETSPLSLRTVSYHELLQATEDFSEANLLGSGSYGSVFKGKLHDGLNVAVKVFNVQTERTIKSFEVECEVISRIHHRNLVRVLSCCSNLDFKALIFEYMSNGSLEKWLYSHNYFLDLVQRLNIAIDVAMALEYIHHGNEFPIVHCDLKPSNVLLDQDMTAHVSDFGISKLFEEGEATSQTKTLATIGYMAPEYGSEGKVSTSGDVYSYGIMLLEMFTRTKPTDDMFQGEMNLQNWVTEAIQENKVTRVVAPGLLRREDEHFSADEQCVSSVFGLALECLAIAPEKRINMIESVVVLKKIRATYLVSTKKQHAVALKH